MRTLADTVARLAAQRRQQQVIPQGFNLAGRLSVLSEFGENPGGLASRYYVPDDHSAGRPLVVVLHGCTQTAAAYDHCSGWWQLADREGFALLYPEQQRPNNPNLCFNWFLPGDAGRDSGEALSIRNMIEAMANRHGIDRSRIFVTGLSAGGAMAAVMLATYPEVFAGGAIIAGLPYGVAGSVPEAFDRMRGHGSPHERELQAILRQASDHDGAWPRISVWHGTADQTVVPSNADAIAAQWQAVHGVSGPATRVHRAGGLTTRVWSDWAGEPVIEVNTIEGMGHGTPLDDDGFGAAGPFMLNVGVSSTTRIARFWAIADAAEGEVQETRSSSPELAPQSLTDARFQAREADSNPFGANGIASSSNPSPRPRGIKTVIEDALRTAGLLR